MYDSFHFSLSVRWSAEKLSVVREKPPKLLMNDMYSYKHRWVRHLYLLHFFAHVTILIHTLMSRLHKSTQLGVTESGSGELVIGTVNPRWADKNPSVVTLADIEGKDLADHLPSTSWAGTAPLLETTTVRLGHHAHQAVSYAPLLFYVYRLGKAGKSRLEFRKYIAWHQQGRRILRTTTRCSGASVH